MYIRFPAIEISESLGFVVVNELADSCNALGWKKGYFSGLGYFDSEGKWWPVVEAKASKPIGILDKMLNRKIKVRMVLGDPVPEAIGLAKSKLTEMIDNDPGDLYDQFVTQEELKDLVEEAKSPRELIEVADNLGYNQQPSDQTLLAPRLLAAT